MTQLKLRKKKKMDWFIYLDADEYIILNTFKKIQDFIELYKDYDSIGINWLMFGSNFYDTPPQGLVIENYTKSMSILHNHVKTIVKTSQVVESKNPHYYVMKNPSKMISIDYKILNKSYSKYKCSTNIEEVPAYIAHYGIQSKETYTKRKLERERDDTGTMRGNIKQKTIKIHNLFNDYENLGPKEKYAKAIKRKMKKTE